MGSTIGRTAWQAFFALALLAGTARCFAQAPYPDKSIKILVPFLPGGSVDLVIRLLAEELTPRLGKPIVIENRAGAGGIIAADAVAKAPPDGYVLLFTAPGPLVTTPFMIRSMPYDAQSAFAPISLVTSTPNVLTVNPDSPFHSIEDVVARAKAHPNTVTYGTPGVGTIGHLAGALVARELQIDLVHVPYKGFPPLLADAKAGRIDVMITESINSIPRIRSGELRALALTAAQRSSQLPNVPTLAEDGHPGAIAESWYALVGPAGTPIEIRKLLADDIRNALHTQKISQRLKDMGVEIRGSSPEELGEYVVAEYEKWGRLIKSYPSLHQ